MTRVRGPDGFAVKDPPHGGVAFLQQLKLGLARLGLVRRMPFQVGQQFDAHGFFIFRSLMGQRRLDDVVSDTK
jgi:hypothetical protein